MSEKLKNQLTVVSLIIGVTVGVLGAVQSVAVIPYRLEATEKAVAGLQSNASRDREALIRMEEQLKQISNTQQKILERLPK
ncbi:MAG TPA: hypothetical protein VD994_09585 [Prosthecobacter sp.]|nr:hypothetical protein [Prosthecobacter sp.]